MRERELEADAARLVKLQLIPCPATPIASRRVVPVTEIVRIQANPLPLRTNVHDGHPARPVLLLNLHADLTRGRTTFGLESSAVHAVGEELRNVGRQIPVPAREVLGRESEARLALRPFGHHLPRSG